MNIAIIEPHYHYSYLHATVSIAQSAGHEVHVFTMKQVWEETKSFFVGEPTCKTTTFDTIADLLRHVLRVQSEFDAMLVNTIQILEWQNLLRLACRRGKCPMAFTMHLPDYWFEHRGYPFWRIRAGLRLWCRNVILQRSKGLMFLSEYAPEYARKRGYRGPMGVLPYGVREESAVIACRKTGSQNKVVFGVPGAINESRDYDLVLSAFERVFKIHGARVCLWLMGWPVGDIGGTVIERCQKLRELGCDIRWEGNEYVSETRMRQMAGQVDWFVLPLSEKLFSGGIRATGTVYDALRLAKPFIIPKFYRLPNCASEGFYAYENEGEFEERVSECLRLQPGEVQALHAHADRNSMQFCPEQWTGRFNEFISELVRN